MVTVLITGRMGSGKSQILDFMKSKGHAVFKADQFARSLLEPQSPCFEDLTKILGPDFLTKNSLIDRRFLAQKLFKNTPKLKKVEKIIHPLVQKGFKNFVEEEEGKGEKFVFYEVPLLSRDALECRFDYIVLVQCPEDLSLKRLEKKGFKSQEIYLRWSLQAEEKTILDLVDFIILNDGDLKHLNQQVEKILTDIKLRIEK